MRPRRGGWDRADARLAEDYVLFDCPGQVELFTHHGALRNIFLRIQKLGYRVRSFRFLPRMLSPPSPPVFPLPYPSQLPSAIH